LRSAPEKNPDFDGQAAARPLEYGALRAYAAHASFAGVTSSTSSEARENGRGKRTRAIAFAREKIEHVAHIGLRRVEGRQHQGDGEKAVELGSPDRRAA